MYVSLQVLTTKLGIVNSQELVYQHVNLLRAEQQPIDCCISLQVLMVSGRPVQQRIIQLKTDIAASSRIEHNLI